MSTSSRVAVRRRSANRDHHLWNNHGTYWCHFTIHLADYTKRRLRRSLGTRDRIEARRRRDILLREPGVATGVAAWPSGPGGLP